MMMFFGVCAGPVPETVADEQPASPRTKTAAVARTLRIARRPVRASSNGSCRLRFIAALRFGMAPGTGPTIQHNARHAARWPVLSSNDAPKTLTTQLRRWHGRDRRAEFHYFIIEKEL